MASTAVSVSPSVENGAGSEVSLLRLYIPRAMYLVLVVGLGGTALLNIASSAEDP